MSRSPTISPICSSSGRDELNTMVPEFWRELPEIVRDIDAQRQGAGHRHLVDRQAFLRRHGPVGVHQRQFGRHGGGGVHRRARTHARQSAALGARDSGDLQRAGARAHAGADRDPGRLRRRRGGFRLGLRLPLCDRGRLLRDPGNQYRHDRRCRHLPAPVPSDARRHGARAGLCRPPHAGEEGAGTRPRQRDLRDAGGDARRMSWAWRATSPANRRWPCTAPR